MKLSNITKSINDKTIFLEWEDVPSKAINYKILFTEDDTIVDNWTLVGVTSNIFFQDSFNYDKTILNKRVVYKIQALDNRDTVIEELIVSSDRLPRMLLDRTLNILRYKANIAFRNSNWSDPVYVLKRRRSGTRCSSCYTRDMRASSKPDCEICYGTGFVGGYYDPIPTYMMELQENIKKRTINEHTATTYADITVASPSFPELNEKDYIILEGVGRFLVQDSSTRSLHSTKSPTSLVRLNLVDPKDPIYKYNIEDKKSTITSIKAEDGGIVVEGTRLIPVFGQTKLIVRNTSNREYEVYYIQNAISITDDKIVFKSSKQTPPDHFKYFLRINGIVFEGIV